MKIFELTRDVTPQECSWLKRTYKAGEIVYELTSWDYGVTNTLTGRAVTEEPGIYPFFEMPKNAMRLAAVMDNPGPMRFKEEKVVV